MSNHTAWQYRIRKYKGEWTATTSKLLIERMQEHDADFWEIEPLSTQQSLTAVVGKLIALARRATEGQAQTSAAPDQIKMRDSGTLRRETKYGGEGYNWLLYADNGELVRALNHYEHEFVESALAAQLADNTAPSKAELNAGFADIIAQNEATARANMANSTAPGAPGAGNKASLIIRDVCELDPSEDGPDQLLINVSDLRLILDRHLSAPTAQQSLTAGGAVPELPPLPPRDVHTGDEDFGDQVSAYSPCAMQEYALEAIRFAAAPLPPVQSESLEPVDGDVLPAVGSKVLIHLGRQDAWVEHEVTGYYVWGDLGKNPTLHRVFVRVKDAQGYDNARLLMDVRAADQQPVTLSGALADNDGGVA